MGKELRRCLVDVAQLGGLHASIVEGPDEVTSGQLTMLAHIRVGPLPLFPGCLAPLAGARTACSLEARSEKCSREPPGAG